MRKKKSEMVLGGKVEQDAGPITDYVTSVVKTNGTPDEIAEVVRSRLNSFAQNGYVYSGNIRAKNDYLLLILQRET